MKQLDLLVNREHLGVAKACLHHLWKRKTMRKCMEFWFYRKKQTNILWYWPQRKVPQSWSGQSCYGSGVTDSRYLLFLQALEVYPASLLCPSSPPTLVGGTNTEPLSAEKHIASVEQAAWVLWTQVQARLPGIRTLCLCGTDKLCYLSELLLPCL